MMIDFMQRVIVKNLTGTTLNDLELSHDGKEHGDYKAKIKVLKNNEKRELAFYTLRINAPSNLILNYTYNNYSKSIIVYNNLSANDMTVITLELTDADGDLHVKTILDNNVI